MRISNNYKIPARASDRFYTVEPTGPTLDIELPAAEDLEGIELTFKVMPHVSPAATITIMANPGGAIDRQPSVALTPGQCVRVRSDGGQNNIHGGIGWLIV